MSGPPPAPLPGALTVRGLRKSYGASPALVGVDLTVARGEVHALVGQNGCGKSTLIKCLTGVEVPDAGEIRLYGGLLQGPPTSRHRTGVAVIHQDIGLVDSMSVLDNLGVVAGFGTRLLAPVHVAAERRVHLGLMRRLGVELELDAPVADLAPAQRALVAVIRALRVMDAGAEHQLFVLDEPTASLSRPEAEVVLSLMRRVADLGSAVLFVSHRLTEVMTGCDTVTVLRDGRDVVSLAVDRTTRDDLVEHMLGRRLREYFPEPPPPPTGPPRLVVDGLTGSRAVDVSFAVRAGEILGLTGLAGMGQEEVPRLIAGVQRPQAGRCELDGTVRRFRGPGDAVAAGLALVPGDRRRDGVWLGGTVEENVTLPVVEAMSRPWRLARSPLRRTARRLVDEFGVRPAGIDAEVGTLSGGNQQKVVFAKWLQTRPAVLLLDEPTQGVDAGAARDLLEAARDLAVAGSAIVVASGDHEMLAAVCHRVVVFHHGHVVAELARPSLDEAALLRACESTTAVAA